MDKEMVKLQLLAVPAFFLVGLGINSLFTGSSAKIHLLLESQEIGIALLVLGGIGAIFSMYKGLVIFKDRLSK